VLGVHRQVVRSVYKITGREPRQEGDRGWEDDKPGRPRWGFVVTEAPEMQHLVGTSAVGLLSANSQWSVRYLTDADFQARDAALTAGPGPHGRRQGNPRGASRALLSQKGVPQRRRSGSGRVRVRRGRTGGPVTHRPSVPRLLCDLQR